MSAWPTWMRLAVLLLAVAACNKAPARDALAECDQRLEAARPLLEAYSPERLAAIRAVRQDAAARFDAGRYTEALKIAQRLPEQIESAAAAARAKRDELVSQWTPIAGRVPLILDGARRRTDDLAALPALPRGIDPEILGEVQAELGDVREEWRRTTALFESGQVPKALESGREVQRRAEAVAARLGLSPAAAMAAAAAPVASPDAAASPQASPAPRAAAPPSPTAPARPRPTPAPAATPTPPPPADRAVRSM